LSCCFERDLLRRKSGHPAEFRIPVDVRFDEPALLRCRSSTTRDLGWRRRRAFDDRERLANLPPGSWAPEPDATARPPHSLDSPRTPDALPDDERLLQ